ncbi:RNA methyltransferase [Desulfovibrio sp. OttesenSCG-928-G11]|nr:RNA methyltransferase [Desulfovibrio sp. OttesenSCG-928-G11]
MQDNPSRTRKKGAPALPDAADKKSAPTPENPAQEQAPLLPGVKPVLEMLQQTPERVDAVFLRKGRHGREMGLIVDICRAAGVRFSLLDNLAFGRVYKGNSQGVVARLFDAGFVDFEDLLAGAMDAPLPLILVLDQVQDPGNAGTLARTLYALGGAGLAVPRHNGVYLGAAAAKAAAGALERLPVAKPANLNQALDLAKKQGFTLYGAASALPLTSHMTSPPAAAPKGPEHINAFAGSGTGLRFPALLVLGGEEAGLRPSVSRRCDYLLSIPMLRDFDSLNVAQAGGILVSCFLRQALNS